MSSLRLSRAKSSIIVITLAGLVWLLLQERPAQSFLFLCPLPSPGPPAAPSCDDSQIVCPEGGSKVFGPFSMTFPNGFYPSKVRIYCDHKDASSLPAHLGGLNPVAQPIACYFGHIGGAQHGQPIHAFLQPIHVSAAIPTSQVSQVAYYMYQSSGWTQLSPDVPISARVITFSLERLNPTDSEELNHFWLFESQATASTPAPVPTTATCAPPPTGWVTYYVQSGNTLYSLAKDHGVTKEAVIAANCLLTADISVGQALLLPPPPVIATPAEATTTPTPSQPTSTATNTPTHTPMPTIELTNTPTPVTVWPTLIPTLEQPASGGVSTWVSAGLILGLVAGGATFVIAVSLALQKRRKPK